MFLQFNSCCYLQREKELVIDHENPRLININWVLRILIFEYWGNLKIYSKGTQESWIFYLASQGHDRSGIQLNVYCRLVGSDFWDNNTCRLSEVSEI